jgi:hypothetical protein
MMDIFEKIVGDYGTQVNKKIFITKQSYLDCKKSSEVANMK